MTTPRKTIIDFIEQGHLPEDNIQKALKLIKISPDAVAWRRFLDGLFLWLGGLALAVSALFFVAYNWTAIGRFAKFGLLEALIFFGIVAYCKFSDHKIIGKLSLLASTLLLGALMALYGQTYQTGADPWQLFFNWALLMLPWAIIGRSPALWILWITLINTAIVLYHQTFRGTFGVLFNADDALYWILFLFNSAALFVWEFLALSSAWLRERWAMRLLSLGSGVSITWLCIYVIFEDHASPLAGLVWLIWGALMHYVYRHVKPDLFMLAGGCMSGIVVIISFLSKHMLNDADAGGFLLLALTVFGLGVGSAMWLKRVNKELQP